MKFLLKIENKRISKYSRIDNNKIDFETNQKIVLRQQACNKYFSQKSRSHYDELHLQNQQIQNVVVYYHESHCFEHYLLYRFRFFEKKRKFRVSIKNVEDVIQTYRSQKF